MKLTRIAVQAEDGGILVGVEAFFSDRQEVEADDVARLTDAIREAAGADEKPKRRGRRKAADADEAKADEEKPKRRGRRKSADADTEEKPKRTRRTVKGISDEDVSKAASEAAQELGPELVAEILKDDHDVDEVSELDQDGRKAFMATLVKEMEAE